MPIDDILTSDPVSAYRTTINDALVIVNAAAQYLAGPIGSRPAANAVDAGTIYFASDTKAEYLSDGANWNWIGGQVPHVRVFDSGGGQSMPLVATAMTFDSEVFDSEGMHSTSSNTDRLTCVTPGLYLVEASLNCFGGATQNLSVFLFKNASYVDVGRQPAVASGNYTIRVSALVRLAAADFMQLKLQSSTGTPGTCSTGLNGESTFEMAFLGP